MNRMVTEMLMTSLMMALMIAKKWKTKSMTKYFKHFHIFCLAVTNCLGSISTPQTNSALCSPENLLRCLAYFPLNSTLLTSAVPYATPDELDQFCGRFEYFVKCYNSIRSQCFDSIPLIKLVVYDGQRDSLQYLCVDGRNDYLSNQACFGDPGLQNECQTCKKSLVSQIEKAGQIEDRINRTNKYCQAGELYLGCVNNNLKIICSEKAANWIMEFNKRTLKPLFSAIMCPGWEFTTTKTETANSRLDIILGVCLTFFCLIILILMVVAIVYCLKTKSYVYLYFFVWHFKQRDRATNPPPYLPTISHDVERRPTYSTDTAESCFKSDFDTSSTHSGSYFTDEKIDGDDKIADLQATCKSRTSTPVNPQTSPVNSKPFSICRLFRNRHSLSDSGFSGAISSLGGNSIDSSGGITVVNNTNGSRDHTLNSNNSKESNSSNPNTSCNSTPSVLFERPVVNPFTRLMSNPEIPTIDPCAVVDGYYC
ncbi:hypothetical protein HELRODRAFT_188104 [Helobdella robusta]|uniref:Uncharacterized protein n=1 Tax=Helobdella robusta TaxID=6412 RepID=T1FPN0_HELRO|nr:hypothetical protein HELRODRAFT_188104 [Helobdella robusta]ESO13100.1 hypothetical protein HELRODRAFT_188104 [Helobdella robusta]